MQHQLGWIFGRLEPTALAQQVPCPLIDALKFYDGVFDPNVVHLVAGAGSSRAGCWGRDHGVLWPQPPRKGCERSDASDRIGRSRAPWRRPDRPPASASCGCCGSRFSPICRLCSVCHGQLRRSREVQCVRLLLLARCDPEFGVGRASTGLQPHGVLHHGGQRSALRR